MIVVGIIGCARMCTTFVPWDPGGSRSTALWYAVVWLVQVWRNALVGFAFCPRVVEVPEEWLRSMYTSDITVLFSERWVFQNNRSESTPEGGPFRRVCCLNSIHDYAFRKGLIRPRLQVTACTSCSTASKLVPNSRCSDRFFVVFFFAYMTWHFRAIKHRAVFVVWAAFSTALFPWEQESRNWAVQRKPRLPPRAAAASHLWRLSRDWGAVSDFPLWAFPQKPPKSPKAQLDCIFVRWSAWFRSIGFPAQPGKCAEAGCGGWTFIGSENSGFWRSLTGFMERSPEKIANKRGWASVENRPSRATHRVVYNLDSRNKTYNHFFGW